MAVTGLVIIGMLELPLLLKAAGLLVLALATILSSVLSMSGSFTPLRVLLPRSASLPSNFAATVAVLLLTPLNTLVNTNVLASLTPVTSVCGRLRRR